MTGEREGVMTGEREWNTLGAPDGAAGGGRGGRGRM